jgi:uncharacterized protein
MYQNGLGVTQDDTEAVKWFRKSADQGYFPAQYNMGGMSVLGRGIKQDPVQAYMWFSLAKAAGNMSSAKEAGNKYSTSASSELDLVSAKMTPEQIAAGKRLVADWKPPNAPRP